jgi:hypothetical protein
MKQQARTQNQYHTPLAVEPESAKEAAAKLCRRFFLGAASVNITDRAEQ